MRHRSSAMLAAALILGLLMRAARVRVRWDELTLAYAAYMEPLASSLEQGHPTALFGSWVGLHPPLYGTIHAAFEVLWPVPLAWMVFSAMASLGAVALVGRVAGPVAAVVLATAPVHLMDAAEINNYPLSSLAVAGLIWAARRHWAWLAAAAVLAAWSHLLGGVAAGAVVLWRLWLGPPVERWTLVLGTLIGVLPILGGAVRLMGMETTWAQPDVDLSLWAEMVHGVLGWEGLLLAPVVALGLRREVAAGWLAIVGALLVAILLGAAAAHQRPYLGLVAPLAAVAIGRAARTRPWLAWAVVAVCLVRGARFLTADLDRHWAIVVDQQQAPRAIDAAIAQSAPGDTLWLVAPALQPDDDKTDFSPVMWRMPPWEPMPIARPVDHEYKDYRYGHPRVWRGRTVHSSTELDPAAFDHVAAQRLAEGGRLWVVLYDHGPATGLAERVARVMRPYVAHAETVGGSDLGADLLIRVEGRK